MRRLLLDANMPRGLRAALSAYQVETTHQRGWATLTNGDLLSAAEADGFDAMITADRNIHYQQNLEGRRIALIELTTSHWETIRDNIADLLAAIELATAGSYVTVPLPRPPKRRRPYPTLEC
jgi:predicted nuclease of predicted toxin-antitoxin system